MAINFSDEITEVLTRSTTSCNELSSPPKFGAKLPNFSAEVLKLRLQACRGGRVRQFATFLARKLIRHKALTEWVVNMPHTDIVRWLNTHIEAYSRRIILIVHQGLKLWAIVVSKKLEVFQLGW